MYIFTAPEKSCGNVYWSFKINYKCNNLTYKYLRYLDGLIMDLFVLWAKSDKEQFFFRFFSFVSINNHSYFCSQIFFHQCCKIIRLTNGFSIHFQDVKAVVTHSVHSTLNSIGGIQVDQSSFVLFFHQLNDSQLKRSSLLGLFVPYVTRILK